MRRRIWLGVVSVAAAGCGGFFDVSLDGPPRVSSAEAKDYYTRKRVNGRWITGRFPKRIVVARHLEKPSAEKPEKPEKPAVEKSRSEIRKATRIAARLALPPRTAQSASLRSAPVAAPDTPPSAPEPLAPAPSDEPMLRLRAALQAHARTIATGSVRAPAAEPPEAAPQPTGVAFDFQTGLKRTTFTDGSVLEEEFDVEVVKGQVAVPGKERGPGGAP